jgi:predicted nucleotide-binding protein (sugar kinase/HSP70/actin superfamily)
MERIVEQSGTPYFCFKDLDENNPAGSIRIRLETMDYFLQRYRESQLPLWQKLKAMREALARYVEKIS